MSVEIQTVELKIGATGLDLKTDPAMLPMTSLTQAENIVYSIDGSLKQRFPMAVNSVGSGNYTTSRIRALFQTREGNLGYVQDNKASRGLALTPVGAPTLQPNSGNTASVPYVTAQVKYQVGPQNLSESYSTTSASDPLVAMAWDYNLDPDVTAVNPTPKQTRVVYWGIWNLTRNTWHLTPRQLAFAAFTGDVGVGVVVGTALPLIDLNSLTMVFSVQFTNGGNSYTQLATMSFSLTGGVGAWNRVTGTQQGPLAGGVYTLPSVAFTSRDGAAAGGMYTPFVWSPMAGATNGKIISVFGGSVAGNTNLTGAIGQTRPITCCWYNGTTYTQILVGDSAQFAMYDFNPATGAFTLNTGPVANSLGGGTVAGQLVCGRNSATNQTYFAYGAKIESGTGMAASTLAGNSILKGANWRYASQIFMDPTGFPVAWIAYAGNITGSLQKTLICMQLLTGTIIGRAAYLAANVDTVTPISISQAADGGYYNSVFAFLSGGSLHFNGGGSLESLLAAQIPSPQITVLSTSWGATDTVEASAGTLVSGLAPVLLTDSEAYELGFSYYPEITAAMFANIGPGAGPIGNVQYCLAYRYIDPYNQVHWSSPSPAITYNAGVGNTVQLPLAATNYPLPTKGIPFWFRTATNGSTFYELGPGSQDSILDAELTTHPFLYTTGGEAQNDPPPPASLVAATLSRAFAVSCENPTQLFYSKPFRVGHPVEWAAGQYLYVAPPTGAITALGVLDDKLVIFKTGNIYMLSGDQGAVITPTFQGPTEIAAASGCTAPGSVITTDSGLFYYSARGIDILKRNITTEYVGWPIDGGVGSITSAALVPILNQVRFLDVTNLCVWVYDYLASRWSRFSYLDTGGASRLSSAALLATAGVMYFRGSNTLEYETAAEGASDQTGAIVVTVETGHIPVSAVHQGFGRLRRFIVNHGTTGARIPTLQLAYDYSGTYVDTLSPSVANGAQWRTRAPRQRMEAMRLKFTWPYTVSPLPVTAPNRLLSLSLELGLKAGVYKLPATQSL